MVVQTAFLLQHSRKTLVLDAARKNISLVPGESAAAQQ